jgi:hypothetical protein
MSKIPTSLARQLAKNYRNLKLGKPLKYDDTHAVWFSRDTILEALNVINPDPNVGVVSGIRFYLGAYEEGNVQPSDNKKGKLTLIIIQTRTVQGKEKDYLTSPNDPPGYPQDVIEYNDGQLCPPPGCDPDGLLNF